MFLLLLSPLSLLLSLLLLSSVLVVIVVCYCYYRPSLLLLSVVVHYRPRHACSTEQKASHIGVWRLGDVFHMEATVSCKAAA